MTQALRALDDLSRVIGAVEPASAAIACRMIADARRIMGYGCGGEGVQIRRLIMRLGQLGLCAFMQDDAAALPLGQGDLLLCAAGAGDPPATVTALMQVAHRTGARRLLVAAAPGGPAARLADHLLVVPAGQDGGAPGSPRPLLPLPSLYEGAMFLLFELMVIDLAARMGQTTRVMHQRRCNIE